MPGDMAQIDWESVAEIHRGKSLKLAMNSQSPEESICALRYAEEAMLFEQLAKCFDAHVEKMTDGVNMHLTVSRS